MIHASPETLAGEFWSGTGLYDTFPRKIEQAIAFKLPLALVGLSPLTVAATGEICAVAWSPLVAAASSSSATPTHPRSSA